MSPKVLDLIPSAVIVSAAQHEVQALQRKLQAELTKKQCTRCGRHVTQQQAAYDTDGCIVYKHTGTLITVGYNKQSSYGSSYESTSNDKRYTCCHSTAKHAGCVKDPRLSHTLAEPFV
jgi:hypothetical protein